MDEPTITIIEGPPPTFEPAREHWLFSIGEGPQPFFLALTRLRTFNGAALVERCYRRWSANLPIHLRYRNPLGLEEETPIFAARSVKTQEGDVLLLWVSLNPEQVKTELNNDSGQEEDW
jgi:hypothetical protein